MILGAREHEHVTTTTKTNEAPPTTPTTPTTPTGAIRGVSVVATGLVAATACAGVVGLVGGGLTFGETINGRLPFGSLVLAGIALLTFVALPMTLAAVAVARQVRRAPGAVFAAGLLLVAWIGIQLAFIQAYSWFQPAYLGIALVVLVLGWMLAFGGPRSPRDLPPR